MSTRASRVFAALIRIGWVVKREAHGSHRVLARAQELHAQGQHQLALHVVDLIAQAPGGDDVLVAARQLKGDCADALARDCPTFVSRSIYFGAARLHRANLRRASEAPDGPGAL